MTESERGGDLLMPSARIAPTRHLCVHGLNTGFTLTNSYFTNKITSCLVSLRSHKFRVGARLPLLKRREAGPRAGEGTGQGQD